MKSSVLSVEPANALQPARVSPRALDDDNDLSAIVDGLFQDAKAIDERNRQLLQRVRALQLMIQSRQQELD